MKNKILELFLKKKRLFITMMMMGRGNKITFKRLLSFKLNFPSPSACRNLTFMVRAVTLTLTVFPLGRSEDC